MEYPCYPLFYLEHYETLQHMFIMEKKHGSSVTDIWRLKTCHMWNVEMKIRFLLTKMLAFLIAIVSLHRISLSSDAANILRTLPVSAPNKW